MSLTLAYSSQNKVDTREDWQKTGKYRWCHAVIMDWEGTSFAVAYCEWGSNKEQYIEGFKSYAAAQLHARGMNKKEISNGQV